jgi:xylulokinase
MFGQLLDPLFGNAHTVGVSTPVGSLARASATPLLGIDVGSTNTKVAVIVVAADGAIEELAVRSVPTTEDATLLLEGIEAAVAAAVIAADVEPAAVGIASMAETGVPLSASGQPLMPLQRWSGGSIADAVHLREVVDPAARFAATGVPFTPKPTLVTLARLRRERPELVSPPNRWAGAADIVALALTGRLATDHTLALRTMAYRLPPAGAPLAGGFDRELTAAAGVDAALLPEVVPPGTAAGAVTPAAASRTRLPGGIPVHVAGHDHVVGAWAAGVRAPGRIADSLGTTEALIRIPARPVDRDAVDGTGTSVVRTVDGELEALLSASTGGGALITGWLATVAPGEPGPLFAAVAALLPDLGGLTVLPYPAGRQAPQPDADATLRLVDAAGRDVDPGRCRAVALARAVLVGLALQARWLADEQARLAGEALAPVTVLGGAGATNEAWLRIKAAVAGAPLDVVTSAEPVAVGAALLAGVRAGLVPDHVALPRRRVPADPVPDLDDRLLAFRAAAGALDLERNP